MTEPFAKVEAHVIGGVIAYFNLIANGTIIDVYDYTCEKRAKQACDGLNLAHTKAVFAREKALRERIADLEKVVLEIADKSQNPYRDRHHECDSRLALQSIHDKAVAIARKAKGEK